MQLTVGSPRSVCYGQLLSALLMKGCCSFFKMCCSPKKRQVATKQEQKQPAKRSKDRNTAILTECTAPSSLLHDTDVTKEHDKLTSNPKGGFSRSTPAQTKSSQITRTGTRHDDPSYPMVTLSNDSLLQQRLSNLRDTVDEKDMLDCPNLTRTRPRRKKRRKRYHRGDEHDDYPYLNLNFTLDERMKMQRMGVEDKVRFIRQRLEEDMPNKNTNKVASKLPINHKITNKAKPNSKSPGANGKPPDRKPSPLPLELQMKLNKMKVEDKVRYLKTLRLKKAASTKELN